MFDEAPFGRLAPVFAVALALTLSACGGGDGSNPVTGGSDSSTDDGTPDEEDTSDGEDVTTPTTGDNTTRTTGDLTGITYNAADNTITVDDLPFDGVDGVYVNTGVTAVAGFNVYASQRGDETGQRQYYAVYRKDTYVEAGSVQTGDYFDFGFGGAQYKRSDDTVTLPIGTGEAVYNGSYGGTRVESGSGNEDDISIVSGTARIEVDFLDFETTSAVEGQIHSRQYYTVDGTLLGNLPTIYLNTANITESGFIESGEANTYDEEGEAVESGSYAGVFAGPNGEQITGVIILEDDRSTVREIGVFTATD
ncbi:hypothetical protein CBW24_11590 [Pacificitalea manganoxidans]|uniref:Transferrin-binding protein B C-lobe/N-lobe beta barrel domain-containing protein n=1 Tax=Pacificitalea manganoxidans TaxID=1411902 RepID=A0A291M1H4_9RHOB|nr:hypothetical protein [Pacificitalea manganoxidans]ATI42585.1 hypothetical protein CBW24_11590 [Pacificitalea manganoxidans]MDR6307545.1 hypothetical protein [Pacificitalea manganoxidans]